MAGEFGISADEVISLLRQMDVPVRSHMSLLTDDQVARARVRWEREKRIRAEAANPAPEAKPRRRRTTAAAAEVAPTPAAEVVEDAPSVRRRRRVDVEAAQQQADAEAEAVEAAAAAEAAKAEAEAQRRAEQAAAEQAEADRVAAERALRRAEAERQAAEAAAQAALEAASAAATAAPDEPGESAAPPAAPAAPVEAAAPVPAPQRPTPVASASPSAPAAPAVPSAPPGGGEPGRMRPRPIVPGAPRGRPSAPFGARPIASAAPGGGLAGGARRDDRRPAGAGAGTGGSGGPSTPSSNTGSQQGGAMGGAGARRGKKGKRGAVDQEAVSANITKTMTAMRGPAGRRGRGRFGDGREELEAQRAEAAEREKKTVRVNEFITVSELAQILGISATQIVGFAFKTLGLMVTINQRLDFDQIELIASEFGFEAVREEEYSADLGEEVVIDTPEQLVSRPAIVTIMGHVDHGKTSLLDYIRKANVVAGEAGGITQHIGAYHVSLPGGKMITFLDTPGHEAFTAMRARGAQVTDIVVLVVAADDQIMPQTIEAISHAKSAGVPLIVAINKVDLPSANPGKVRQDLLQHDVVLEDFGGTVLASEISAKHGTGVPGLLDQILLQAEILDLKANPVRNAVGTVVEAQLDPGKGSVATVLVQNGTLKVGDDFICGMFSGRVRALLDERGKIVKSAGPAIPVQILGLPGVPMAGDQMIVVEDASQARDIAQRRERLDREARSRRTSRGNVSLEDFMSQTAAGEKRQLRLLIKADQGGPAEALADSLGQLSTTEVSVDIVHRGVGAITESDILLAKASGAIIIGFHVRPDNNARQAAEREGVDIKLYRIIYEAVADVRSALEGMLRPESREVVVGEAEVRDVFKVARVGTIAGSYVRSGTITRGSRVRVIRDGVEIYAGTLGSLRRFKDDAKEVKEGYECGIGVENFNDIKVGDILECYKTEVVARTLDDATRSS
jgi:translation initiation factor IF-2